jgi:large subunit ribosomal protein L24
MKIHKNDKVLVLSGKYKGKEGNVEQVFPTDSKVTVKGINVVKRHVKPGRVSQEGGIISMEKPFDASNVLVICKSCNKPTRVGYKMTGDKKYRVCKKCNSSL